MGSFPYLTDEENPGVDTLNNWLPVVCVLMTELGQESRFLIYKKMHFPFMLQQIWIISDYLGVVPILDTFSLLLP